ncbi:MAG: hypothetical protein ACP5OE_09785 [Thermodesulfobium sp.]
MKEKDLLVLECLRKVAKPIKESNLLLARYFFGLNQDVGTNRLEKKPL